MLLFNKYNFMTTSNNTKNRTREPHNRRALDIRPTEIQTHVNKYAEGSALIKMGNTHVLCVASVEEKVPDWLKGKGQGWVTAEYSMLPRSTHTRTKREREKTSGRTQEIQRLIGRSLRAAVNLEALGERSITIDCDVLQADGGTRTASITGGCVALYMALLGLEKKGIKITNSFQQSICAISAGLFNGNVLLDLDYVEDSNCETDMNFVMTENKEFIELQGTAEKKAFSHTQLLELTQAAYHAQDKLVEIQRACFKKIGDQAQG